MLLRLLFSSFKMLPFTIFNEPQLIVPHAVESFAMQQRNGSLFFQSGDSLFFTRCTTLYVVLTTTTGFLPIVKLFQDLVLSFLAPSA